MRTIARSPRIGRASSPSRPRIVRTARGARLLQGDAVLSEVLARAGPTHRFFDVLAASVIAFAPGPRFLMLGFAAGGMVAPLRGGGWAHAIHAVDRSDEGHALYRELSAGWGGPVHVERADALRFLRGRRRWDLVLDDLSVEGAAGVTKPRASAEEVPGLVARRLRPGGVAMANLLGMPDRSWRDLLGAVRRPWPRALVITAAAYQNRVVVAGHELPAAREAGRRLRAALAALGSRMRGQVAVRTLAEPAGDFLGGDGNPHSTIR